jgi:hypothetical protein
VIIGVPGEFTTMAGRRIRAAVADTIGNAWGSDLKVKLHASSCALCCLLGCCMRRLERTCRILWLAGVEQGPTAVRMRMLAGVFCIWLLHGQNAALDTTSCCCCCRQVVLSGLSGTYSSYITTWEEYRVQRYEGASTLYGPHTLDAYIQTVLELVQVTVHAMQMSMLL